MTAIQKKLRSAAVTLLLLAGFGSSTALAETLFINDATVHTLSSRSVLQNGDILIRDGRIQALGFDLQAPADAMVLEAAGRPVTPGFFAGLTQMGLVEISAVESTVDGALSQEALRPEFDVSKAFNPNSSLIPITRVEGYTWTVLAANRAGSIIGGQGRPVFLDDGYDSFAGLDLLYIDIGGDASDQSGGSRAAQWMLLEQAMAEADSELRWTPDPLLTPAGRNTLVQFRNSGAVVFHVDRASDILQALEFAAEHELNPVINGGAEAWMVADQLAERGAPVLLNALSNLPGNFDMLGARLNNAALLNEAGVVVSFAGAGTHQARKLRQFAGNAVANGLPWDAGLAALTASPARIFGLDEGHGTLVENGPADLVIWSGDPLEVTSVADQVVIGGRAIEMVSRQTLLRDRYLEEAPGKPRAYVKP